MKRAGDETGDDFNKKTKQVDEDGIVREKKEFEARFLIEKRIMGLIIGKGGSRIKAMREETGVYASILKVKQPQESASERVMVLQGNTEQISHAVRNVAQLMVDNALEREQKNNTGEPSSAAVNACKITILCDMTQAGAIIGKGGTTIKQTQADTGAKMQVSKDALPGSTERSCQVTGTVDVLEAATLMVLNQLKEYPSTTRETIHYVPNNAINGMPVPSPYGAGGFGAVGQTAPPHAPQPAFNHFQQSPFGAPSPYGQPEQHHFAPPPQQSGPQSKQQIAIPTMCAGGVIGKGGHRIREIQSQSETTIQIAPADPASPLERIVSISGPSSGIQTAVALIRHAVEQEYQPAMPAY